MPFQLTVLPNERRIEVSYPDAPGALEVADYGLRLHKAINEMKGTWCILVDQRQLRFMAPEVQRNMSSLAAYAQARGMRRGARLVCDAVSGLQVWRMHKEAGLTIRTETFTDRETALAWLYSEVF